MSFKSCLSLCFGDFFNETTEDSEAKSDIPQGLQFHGSDLEDDGDEDQADHVEVKISPRAKVIVVQPKVTFYFYKKFF